ncbi:HU family DNA-binding protein [[Mycobacterium] fortunisiensis]|uniref:HU family DNA-binding protein n=1 Tax=[Mycobacterium] fortunisiensis TaxID=2600579 RepID=UPI001C258B95
MNKAELIDELARKLGTDHRYATVVLEKFVDTIVRTVHEGDPVTITGFGAFEQRRRQVRGTRNPRSGEIAKREAVAVPVFRPSAQFKAVVSGAQRLPRQAPDPRHRGGNGRAGEDTRAAAGPTRTSAAAAGASASLQVVTMDTVHPVHALATESAEVKQTVSGPAVQKEARLTERFQRYLETHGRQVMRYRITPAGTPPLYSDLADTTENILYEAKGTADRMSVRLALGQILDYGRYVEGSRLAVLLPDTPTGDLVGLLEQHGIGCVIETTPGNFLDLTALQRCPTPSGTIAPSRQKRLAVPRRPELDAEDSWQPRDNG